MKATPFTKDKKCLLYRLGMETSGCFMLMLPMWALGTLVHEIHLDIEDGKAQLGLTVQFPNWRVRNRFLWQFCGIRRRTHNSK